MADEPCVHERENTFPLGRFFFLTGLPCAECAAEEHAAWLDDVRAKLAAGLEAAAQGERYDWDAQPEYPPPRAWPRTAGVFHVQFDETAHPVSECTDACRPVDDAPYVARPGWIVRVQSFTPLHDPVAGGPVQMEGRGDG